MRCASCDAALPAQARFCPACGTPRAAAPVAEKRQLVTAVFCDLVGSTALSERLDPETLRVVVLRYFEAMRGQIERFDGTVEKFIGDAVMAVFGVPVMHEDDAWRAASAALGMRDALADLNAELEPAFGVRLRVRIGVHTGSAVASTDASSRQALVSGDTVNIAARLEQNAGEGEILIGPLTRQALGAAARVESVGPLALKGKQEPLPAYRLLGVDADAPELSRRFDHPLVGRTAELAALDGALAAVVDAGGAALVTVCGEAGIGKTRLVRAWLDGLGGRVALGVGRCRPYGAQGSLAPLANAVRDLLGGAPAEAVLAEGLLRDGTPGPSPEATGTALARLLRGFARERPVLLVLDDCQWAGDTLLDLLLRLTAAVRGSTVLIVCLARWDMLERRRDWTGTIVLDGLSVVDSERLAASLVEVSAHRSVEWSRILEVAGGNPFYLEQLLATLDETDRTDALPHTLQALLGARIDALEHPERSTLNLAAVVGREFTAGQVDALAGTVEEATPVRAALTALSRRRLVEPAGARVPGDAAMRFSNGLVHEVTYQAITKRTRAEWHERTADLLAGWRAGHAAVAGHLEHAYRYRTELGLQDPSTEALRRRAADSLAAAGAQAFARSDLAWAGPLLRRATQLYRTGEEGWAGATRQLGELRLATGHADEGRALLAAVLAHAAEPTERAHAELALAVAAGAGGAAAVARTALPVFAAAGDELGQARAHIRIAQEWQLHGQHERAEGSLATGLGHASRRAAEPELALALGALGVSLWRGPAPVPAAVARCFALLDEYGGPRPVVRVTLSCPLAVLLALDDRPAAARALLAEVAHLVEELEFAEAGAVLPLFAAAVEATAGAPQEALRLLERAAERAAHLGAGGLPGTIAREAARLLLHLGRPAEAAARLDAAGDPGGLLRSDLADVYGLRARLAAAAGDAAGALEPAERAVAAAAGTDSPLVRAVAALDRAEVLVLAGRPAQARAARESARRAFAAKGHRPGLREIERLDRTVGED
ncbi:guanylate cyclase [Virgisporangium aliadipatigenens]|uniref:Guanylate cyclase n=1 Tax=Virgisporangium aliadipatigenens TaxID=741659 RepID=A0A8J3YQ63_9ACTN|nr:adenylate/guanylate cyclase domain-containing protein [Virgisporangium aliadipatigenens]GIJ47871.1 guanylate cyclase [Virgisporangium aliadipatigenens]